MISIRPKYFSQFKCDGKSCSSRCCKGWRVAVDERTHSKYLAIEDEAARQEIISQLELSDDSRYFFKMKDNQQCPFLDEDSLCKIQKRHGEDYLTAICHSYPRVTYKLGEVLEQSLTLTCPIAARLILLPKTSMEFEEVDIEAPRGVFDRTSRINIPVEEAVQLQATAVSILQDRQLDFDERLMRLSLLLRDESDNKVKPKFDLDRHAEIMIDIFDEMYDAGLTEEKKVNLKRVYLAHSRTILQRLQESYHHSFENYLVNEFFMRCYPFAFEGGLQRNCKIFTTAWKAVEFALVLTAISKNGYIGVEEFLTMIDAVSEKLDHNRDGMKAIINKVYILSHD